MYVKLNILGWKNSVDYQSCVTTHSFPGWSNWRSIPAESQKYASLIAN